MNFSPTIESVKSKAPEPHFAPLAQYLGRCAVASLHAELFLSPKPGLVTPFDSGSHADMNAATFMQSLFALRSYFVDIAKAGYRCAKFAELNSLGRQAEARMMRATGGINTHRGAIFSLGLLSASAAALLADGQSRAQGEMVCENVALRWGDALDKAKLDANSHGQRVVRRYAVGGARLEAVNGFPLLQKVALPTLRAAKADGLCHDAALAQTFMRLVSELDDTNLLHRGGSQGLAFAKDSACDFLLSGGCYSAEWRERLMRLGLSFVSRRLSPGGSADLLACTLFLIQLETP